QVQRKASNQGASIRLRRRFQSLSFQPGENKSIDRVSNPLPRLDIGLFRTRRRDESPVLLPRRPFLNPSADGFDLLRIERLVRILWRHTTHSGGSRDALIHQALLRFGSDDRRTILPFSESAFLSVQLEIHHAGVFVRTMALEAVVGKNRPDLTLEID